MQKKNYKIYILAIVFILLSSMVITAENNSLEIKELQEPTINIPENLPEEPNQNIEETILLDLEQIEMEQFIEIKKLPKKPSNITLIKQKDGEENNSSSSPSFKNNSLANKKNLSENQTNALEKNQTYIDLDKIIQKINESTQTNITLSTQNVENNSLSSTSPNSNQNTLSLETPPIQKETNSQPKEETIKIQLYKNGKKEIEGKIPKDFTAEIKKSETEISDTKKEVIIKSNEHLDAPLTIYSDIEETKNKEDIKIHWKNENKEIKIKKYLDTNNDGLIDRISWIVPHLSEQIFEITIIPITNDESEEILLEVEGLESILTNPISFTVDVNYTNWENLTCEIEITNSSGTIINLEENEINLNYNTSFENADLPNGDYNWEIHCEDQNTSKENSISGTFEIDEKELEISGLNTIYLTGQDIEFEVITPQNFPFDANFIEGPNTPFGANSCDEETCYISFNSIGQYTLQVSNNYYAETTYRNQSFYISQAETSDSNIYANINEETILTLKFKSYIPIEDLKLNHGDSKINQTFWEEDETFLNETLTFKHNYTNKGTYNPEFTFKINDKEFFVEGPKIIITDPDDDNEAPEITLKSPKDNSIIESETITFIYEVDDDESIDNCVYELYIKQDSFKELDYTTKDSSIILNEENEVKLTSFEDGDYTWYVICEDNQGKESEESRDFTIKTTKHEYEDEVEEAITNLDNFLEKMEDYTLEKKEVLEDLGITEDLNYYKKRLPLINQDLGTNLKFMTNENLKQERIEETIEELKEIGNNIPKEIEIIESTEFIKNSLTNLEKITEEYIEGKKIQLKSRDIKRLAQENYFIQEELSVTTKIKTVEIVYKDRIEKITSVKKEINLMDDSYKTILEKIPNEIKEIEFKTKSQEVNKNLFEIKIENIKNDEIIYYIKEEVKLNDLKETETILFEEFPLNRRGITGYFTFNGSNKNNSAYYIIFIIFLTIALYFGKDIFKKFKMNIWKKEEDVRRIIEYTEKAKRALQENNQELAKQYYHKIKEIFNLTPKGFRNYIYPTIKKIRIGIDKRDMQNFIKEYEQAKQENRKEDALRIYQNIREQYKKLPQKHQEKVYERVIKKGAEGFSF